MNEIIVNPEMFQAILLIKTKSDLTNLQLKVGKAIKFQFRL